MPKGFYERNLKMKSCLPKLSKKQDKEISSLYLSGLSQQEVAEKFSCGKGSVYRSLKRTKTSTDGRKGHPGSKNPSWKGGKIQDKDGYVLILLPDNVMANSQGYVREHRLVMSQLLKRPLTKKEVVHHKNGNHSDNHPENLLMFSSNGVHLGVELLGKKPKWTEEGLDRIASRSAPLMKGIPHCSKGNGVRKLRRKLIQKFQHETFALLNTGLEAELELPQSYQRNKKKH